MWLVLCPAKKQWSADVREQLNAWKEQKLRSHRKCQHSQGYGDGNRKILLFRNHCLCTLNTWQSIVFFKARLKMFFLVSQKEDEDSFLPLPSKQLYLFDPDATLGSIVWTAPRTSLTAAFSLMNQHLLDTNPPPAEQRVTDFVARTHTRTLLSNSFCSCFIRYML